MNMASYPVTLQRGMVLGDLKPVEEMDRGPRTVWGLEVNVEGSCTELVTGGSPVRSVGCPTGINPAASRVCPGFLAG